MLFPRHQEFAHLFVNKEAIYHSHNIQKISNNYYKAHHTYYQHIRSIKFTKFWRGGDTYKEISFFSTSSQTETITIEALCCNKNLPTLLNIGDIQTSDIKDVRTKNIKNPSPMRKYNADNLLWKLVSILSFNYQTMLNKTSFFNVLEAYSFLEDKENVETYKLLKESIVDIQGKSTYLVDGYITKKGILTIFYIKDSNFYSLGEVYRLGLILSKFLSSFASINSFCELKIRCLDSKETLYYSANFGKKPIL